ncbi:MAG: Fe(3+)-hydroxamate ABC transporter permease FhuB [Streptosporangiales bacterium]|nr:Fe(3+)-hydroxamate ABC transporter permease FhuB [Streptosporangiales bacterium]
MTETLSRQPAPGPTAAPPAPRWGRTTLVLVAGLVLVAALGLVHVTQGTSDIGPVDLLRLVFGGGGGDSRTLDVLIGSRVPRLLAGLVVGIALGVSGALLQSVARNALATPDTLGVNAGAGFAVVLVAVLGTSLPALSTTAVAFAGGLLAAGLVLALSSGAAAGPTRLVLAGMVVTLALAAGSQALQLIDQESTVGLFAWGDGSLVQSGTDETMQVLPVIGVGVAAALLLCRPLDILALGDDTARVLGIKVGIIRVVAVIVAVLLAASAVSVAGKIGFVGLLAPTVVRLLGVHRLAGLIPAAAVAGCVVVLGADVLTRAVLGGAAGVDIPAGVVTSLFGAPVLIWLARRHRDSGPTRTPPAAGHPAGRSTRYFAVIVVVVSALLVAAVVVSMLIGDRIVLLGDVMNWIRGTAGGGVTFVLDQRFPRVVLCLLTGAALALAGAAVQAVARNPLAEPGILGVTGGAGVGAVALIVLVPGASAVSVSGVAAIGAVAAFVGVYLLAWRRGMSPDRLVLVGVGMGALTAAITTALVVRRQYDIGPALVWLAGSTYGRSLTDAGPVAVMLVLAVVLAVLSHRHLDLLALDEDTPRVLGVRLEPVRLAILGVAVLLTAAAVSAAGVIGFVGLVAPHAARAVVGGRHRRVLAVSALFGATLVCVADTVGRTVIAPGQLPAGLLTALLGTPYFLWLLWRSRARGAA